MRFVPPSLYIRFILRFIYLASFLGLMLSGQAWATISITQGANQIVNATASPALIEFLVTDANNQAVGNASINFSLRAPDCTDASSRLSSAKITDSSGKVTVSFGSITSTTQAGLYVLTATLQSDSSQTLSTNFTVTRNSSLFIVGGNCQTVNAGTPSEFVTAQLLDSTGAATAGVNVTFSLLTASNQTVNSGLIGSVDDTDNQGQAFTRVSHTTSGTYKIVATVGTSSVSTTITLSAERASLFSVASGDKQTIPSGRTAKNIVFKLVDGYGNLASNAANQAVTIKLLNASGVEIASGLDKTTDTTSSTGEVTVSFVAPTSLGSYSIQVALTNTPTIKGTATLTVTQALAGLPSLGFNAAVDNNWKTVQASPALATTFNGGVALDDGNYSQQGVFKANSGILKVNGIINVDSRHVGKEADLIVIAIYTDTNQNTQFISFSNNGTQASSWTVAQGLTAIPSFKTKTLDSTESLTIYQGLLSATGLVHVVFGYRLKNEGIYVFNGEYFISFMIEN